MPNPAKRLTKASVSDCVPILAEQRRTAVSPPKLHRGQLHRPPAVPILRTHQPAETDLRCSGRLAARRVLHRPAADA
jgi:hypothetical protein